MGSPKGAGLLEGLLRPRWAPASALAVPADDSDRTAREITAQADTAEAGRRRGTDACVRYLDGKREFLRYDQALANGWPIATRVIEGTCRHLRHNIRTTLSHISLDLFSQWSRPCTSRYQHGFSTWSGNDGK